MNKASAAVYPSFWVTARRFGDSFRLRRNVGLAALIKKAAASTTATVRCLDVGGSPVFWETVDPDARSLVELTLLNRPGEEQSSRFRLSHFRDYALEYGDARDLGHLADGAYDLVVSNSVIEHLGSWSDIKRGCREMQRVGRFGWVQTPALSCFWEPHAQLPFVHWFATPLRARLVARFSLGVGFSADDIDAARVWADQINLLTKAEVRALFPHAELRVERFFLWPKSYIIAWSPRDRAARNASCAEPTMTAAASTPRSRPSPRRGNGRHRSEPDH
jgi:Methyltransferase domain